MLSPPDELPPLAGGWTERSWTIAGHTLSLVLPAKPDALLDDADVLLAHERDGYMPYWAYLWPASIPMAEAIFKAPWSRETPVLEVGAGVGFVGLAAAMAGYQTVITDYDATAIQLALFNARRMGLSNVIGHVLDWREPQGERFPVIIGCEILYEDRNHEMLLDVLQARLQPGGVAWFGDGGRVRAERFMKLSQTAGFNLTLRDEQGEVLNAPRAGRYQLLELKKAT
jgi:predicted nicotinamide N-methyase